MTHSIELLPDDAADAAIRAQWTALAEARVPSAAQIRASTNRPHVTLVAARRIGATTDTVLAPVAQRLPVRARLGAPIVFGHGSHRTLARLVVPSTELLSVHAGVHRLAGGPAVEEAFAHSQPGSWTPHITLARRLTAAQVATALDLLDAQPESDVTFVALRRWDGDAHTEHILAGRAC